MNEIAETQGGFYTEDMTISVGPQHPSTHGVLRFVVKTDGEVISEALPDVGYLHRSIEKIGEKVTYHGYVPYTDRADYLAAMFANQAFCMAAEKLAGTPVTRRGEFCRVIACELNRIASHLISVGTFGQDIGAMTPFVHALRERATINNLMEEICGARLTYNYIRIGGVGYDILPETCSKILQFLNHFEPIVAEFNRLLSGNKIFIERLAGVAVVSKEEALSYNLVGPNLRGSGIKWDIRRDIPYSVYPELEFDVPVGTAQVGKLGDSYDRYWVRIREMPLSPPRVVELRRHAFPPARESTAACGLPAGRGDPAPPARGRRGSRARARPASRGRGTRGRADRAVRARAPGAGTGARSRGRRRAPRRARPRRGSARR